MLKNLSLAIIEKYVFQKNAAKAMGIDAGNLSSLVKNRTPGTLRGETISHIQRAFPEYNLDWILERSTIKLKADLKRIANIHPSSTGDGVDLEDGRTVGKTGNATFIGNITEQTDTKFIEISPGRYRMRVPLVDEAAKAGYLMGFADKEYKEELPYHETIVDRFHRGTYMAFQISGDSMNNGSSDSILDGSIVTGRIIKRELWRSRLHSHQWPYWIFVTRTEGIVCKMIATHDVDAGNITLRSLNPDKETYPDFDVHLDDIYQIFNIIKVERTF